MAGEPTGGMAGGNGEGDRAERNGEPAIAVRVLRRAATQGIITEPQLDALLSFAVASAPGAEVSSEVRRGLNAVTVAYWAGALAVVFALGWFLVDRWRDLGPGGVLAVSAGYAVVFALAARRLASARFHTAASFATLLVVGMIPLMTWAVISMIGFWPTGSRVYTPELPGGGGGRQASELVRWIPIDIATLVASLVALRLVRFDVLALPAALAWCYLPFHILPAIIGMPLSLELEGWTALVSGTSLLTVGYLVERRQQHQDYAAWIYVVGLGAMVMAAGAMWGKHQSLVPHLVLVGAVASIAIALRLRRRSFLVAGAIGFIAYLGWLAFDVFRRTLGFPIVLAAFGLAVILLAVWVQRRFPSLASRMESDRLTNRRSLPGGVLPFALAFVTSLVLLVVELPAARERHELRVQRERELLARIRADSVRQAPKP